MATMWQSDDLLPADAERHARILAVAQREFLHEGFEGCSVDRIAAGAEVSKREVYRYFRSKTALFEAVAHDIFGRASRIMAGTPGGGRSRRAVLLRYANGVLTAYGDRNHLQLLRAAIAAGRHFPQLAAELQRARLPGPMAAAFRGRWMMQARIAPAFPALSAVRLGSLAIDGSRFLLGSPLPSPRQRAELAEGAVALYLGGYRSVGSRSLPFAQPAAGSATERTTSTRQASLRLPPERLQALLEAALEQFLDKGYRAVNLDRVAMAAGVSNATVYRRFGNKEGLFRHVIGERIAGIGAAAPRRFESGSLESDVTALARSILDWHVRSDSIALQRLMIEEAPEFPDLARRLHDTLAGIAARDLQAVLEAHGQPAAGDMAARTFRSLATLGPWLIEICETPDAAERQVLSRETARIFLRGAETAETRRPRRLPARRSRKAVASRVAG